jgi:hypothetical protein
MDTPATSSKPEHYYSMPEVGLTETRANIYGRRIVQYTIRCGSVNCWFVGHAMTPADAQVLLNDHTCPQYPKRNELPTGRSTLDKTWDELDDAVAALMEKREYNNMEGVELKGYVRGIAFMLSMMTHPYFKTITDISREAGARYKMSTKKIPWRPTPGYHGHDPRPEPFTANVVSTSAMTRTTPAKKKAAPRAKPAAPAVSLSADVVRAIKAAGGSGMFSPEDLAGMYGTNVETIKQLIA